MTESEKMNNAFCEVLMAMKKQEPREPIQPKDCGIPDVEGYVCPTCLKVHSLDEGAVNYCSNCGQAFSWRLKTWHLGNDRRRK